MNLPRPNKMENPNQDNIKQQHDSNNYSLLSTLDFKPIEDMDPSLTDGHRIMYDREVPFELRTQESAQKPHDVGTLEGVKVKVLEIVGSVIQEKSYFQLDPRLSSVIGVPPVSNHQHD